MSKQEIKALGIPHKVRNDGKIEFHNYVGTQNATRYVHELQSKNPLLAESTKTYEGEKGVYKGPKNYDAGHYVIRHISQSEYDEHRMKYHEE